jgi:hypothetical protein
MNLGLSRKYYLGQPFVSPAGKDEVGFSWNFSGTNPGFMSFLFFQLPKDRLNLHRPLFPQFLMPRQRLFRLPFQPQPLVPVYHPVPFRLRTLPL